jgi:hypothetical protein
MEGAELPNRGPRLLYSFNTPEQASDVVLGCDADVGGFSSVNFALDTTSESERVGRPTGKFFGNLRLDVRPELIGRINSGYAGFKTEVGACYYFFAANSWNELIGAVDVVRKGNGQRILPRLSRSAGSRRGGSCSAQVIRCKRADVGWDVAQDGMAAAPRYSAAG